MRLESLKKNNLYAGDKTLEFILVPKCPLFGDSAVTPVMAETLVTQCSPCYSVVSASLTNPLPDSLIIHHFATPIPHSPDTFYQIVS